MIHDAQVEVSCDGPRCFEHIYVSLPFNYPDLSGRNGRYEHRPECVNPLIEKNGWLVKSDDEHYCEECRQAAEAGG